MDARTPEDEIPASNADAQRETGAGDNAPGSSLLRNAALAVGALIVAAAGVVYGLEWWTTGRFVESTNNAYVRGEITPISPRVSGYVTELLVSDNEQVDKGDVLLKIEDDEHIQQIAGLEAEIERLNSEVSVLEGRKSLQSYMVQQAGAEVAIAEAERDRAAAELERSKRLSRSGNTSAQTHELNIAAHSRALGEIARSNARLQAASTQITILEAEEKKLGALLRKAEAELNILKIRLDDTIIRAPVAGVVGNRSVRTGQLVEPGRFLMAIVPLDGVWIEGNFKETQLTRFEEGLPVDIKVDTFPNAKIVGTVSGLSPASGAEFSILPPQNATGNFTKIVQRIPVKISIDPNNPVSGRLIPGMSCTVKVDTKAGSQSRVAATRY